MKVQEAVNSNFLLDPPKGEEEELEQIVEQPRPEPQNYNIEELS
jgi:hypothetical protein